MAVFRWTDKSGANVYLKFDAVTVVELTRESDVSEHPVEVGADVTDHVKARLPRVSVTAFMSESPLYSNDGVEKLADFRSVEIKMPKRVGFPQALGQGIREAFSPGKVSVQVLTWTDLRSRVREARDKLTDIQLAGTLISITDAAGDFDNLVIDRFSTIRALEDGRGATFNLECRQIRLTTVEEVDAPIPAEVRGQRPKVLGNQAARPDEKSGEQKKEKLKSLAARLYDGAGSLF